jgi:hypothetical protein
MLSSLGFRASMGQTFSLTIMRQAYILSDQVTNGIDWLEGFPAKVLIG